VAAPTVTVRDLLRGCGGFQQPFTLAPPFYRFFSDVAGSLQNSLKL